MMLKPHGVAAAALALCHFAGSVGADPWPSTQPTFGLGIKALLLKDAEGLTDSFVPSMIMRGYGSSFESHSTMPDLSAPDYNALVVTRNDVSADELSTMRGYCSAYGVRIVYLNAMV